MPHARFAWTNLPLALLGGLARDLGLDIVDHVSALKADYGVVPTESLAADTWVQLRERWLAHAQVIVGLR